MRQHPIVNIQHAAFALVLLRKVYVVTDIYVDTIVVDWVHDFPVKGFLLSNNIVISLFQAAVRNGDEVVGRRDTDLHAAIRFVRPVIFVGPPDARADALTSSDDKMLSEIVSSPGYATNPRWILTCHRNSFVEDFDYVFDSLRKILVKHHPVDISFAFEFQC